ncbi:MAG: ABC transporter ATP-binding protein [Coriobacteriales bacterium]|jgi:iron complex transport system ATP-binding protein|nr:ABC transporter ATP-binding protein [Coriobacteriales bacterium]
MREEHDRNAADAGSTHTHLHEHTDGTLHNHYHSHRYENAPHSHRHGAQQQVVLKVNQVTYRYPHAPRTTFSEINFTAQSGNLLAILGNNGAGKSTLLSLLSGLLGPSAGTVDICGKNLRDMSQREIARQVASVFQQQRVPHLSVYNEVLLGRRPHISWGISDYDRTVVARVIERLGLNSFAQRYVDQLSGGERQKVFIARALAQEPQILLLDEPTSALDPKNQIEVLGVVQEITRSSSLATVLVLHDINLALRYCDNFLLLRDGRTVAYGGLEAVTDQTLMATYGHPLHVHRLDGTPVVVPE